MAPNTPIIHPTTYFETQHSALPASVIVVATYIVLSLLVKFATTRLILDHTANLPPGFDPMRESIVISVIVSTALFTIIMLVGSTAIMHYGSSGTMDGSFTDTLAVAGWAYAPHALAMPLSYLYTRATIPSTIDASDPETFEAHFAAAQVDEYGVVPILTLAIVCAWSIYILTYGTAGSHDIDRRDTILPALLIGLGAFALGL